MSEFKGHTPGHLEKFARDGRIGEFSRPTLELLASSLLAQNERLADALRLTLTLAEESIHDDRRFRASVISDGRALLARLDSGA